MPKINPDGKYLKKLTEQDWPSLLEDIALYAGTYFHYLPPDEREEMIHKAIDKIFSGDQAWDSTERPRLLDHFKWVFKSVTSNESKLSHHQKRAGSVKDDDGVLTNPVELVSDGKPLQDEALEVKSSLDEIRKALEGDEEAELVFLSYEDGARKPSEAAEATGYDVSTVNNALKRIRRRWALINSKGVPHE